MQSESAENQNLQVKAQELLMLAKKRGASAAEVAISSESGFNVTVRMGDVETLEHHQKKDLSLNVYFGQRMGCVSTSDLSSESLQNALDKACTIARFTGEDDCAGLADAELMAYNYPDLSLWHLWNITPQQAIELAYECETLARNADKKIVNSEGASVSSFEDFNIYANTHGFIGAYPATSHSISCALIASDGHELQRDFEYTTARDSLDLMNIETLASKVAARTVNRLGARQLSTRKSPVIFSAELARSLLGNFISAISGSNIYRESSFLFGAVDKAVFPIHITLDERPHLLKAKGSSPFDSDGVRTQAREWIREGVLTGYMLGSYSARKLKLRSTGNADGMHNLFINTNNYDLAELIKLMGTGLLVTELFGQGVNIVTGDYSRGAFGYWIENGQIQYPVHEITIAGNLQKMFLNIIAVSNDVDHRGNINTGSILIDHMMIAGQ